jgi:DNA-binding transcriptional ArsR family regulator
MPPLNDLFQALSDPTRREVLRLLRQRDMTAGQIAEAFPLAFSTISGHLKTLKYAGLVVTERQGTTIVYSLNISALEEAVAAVLEFVGAGKPPKGKKP